MERSHAGELSAVHACYPRTQDSEVRGSRFKTRDGKETPVGKVRRLKTGKISVPLLGPKVERTDSQKSSNLHITRTCGAHACVQSIAEEHRLHTGQVGDTDS